MKLAQHQQAATQYSVLSTEYSVLSTRYSRAGFTLVELLVVIAIIAILFSLTSAAVINVIRAADDTANRTNIGHLETAVESFKGHFGVRYMPSRIWLDESMQYAGPPPGGHPPSLTADSKTYLSQLWPRLKFGPGAPAIDWNGSGTAGDSSEVLEGDQCLVFFLGGIPSQTGIATSGFSTNKTNPAALGSGDVIQPFFEFRSSRLVKIHGAANRYLSYMDYYGRADGNGNVVKGKPYAYLSSYKSGNDYQRYAGSDCALLGPWPYFEQGSSPTVFHNRNGFQIISAGTDGLFGPGGGWSSATASSMPADGRDDQANFYDRKLGASQ